MKKVIINADDFGHSKNVNEAIMISHKEGILSSTSLMANMDGFNNAVYEIYPQIKTIDIGFHFNLTEGKSLSKNKLLCDTNGYFNNGFLSILLKSGDKKFLNAVEEEFRIQIEKTLNEVNISHIDSHRHIHAIPAIFQITKKLAEERKLTLFPIAVGSDDNEEKYRQVMDVLNGFSNKSAKHLKDLKFSDFFEWLGKSVTIVSASKVGDKVRLDTTGMDDWAEI